MTIINTIKNLCYKLGNNNKSIYPVIAIATANGIFRPTFTMLKKGENPESKKYAALREGLTEVIAVPTYWACGELGAKWGKKIVSDAMDKKIAADKRNGTTLTSAEIMEMKSTAIKRGQSGLMLLGVLFAAGVVIPALCTVAVTPIMKKLRPKEDIKTPKQINTNPTILQNQINKRPVFKSMSYGMRIGGL